MNIQIIYLIFQKTWTGTFNGMVLGQHVSGPGLDSQPNKKQNKTKNPQVKDFKFYSYSMYGLSKSTWFCISLTVFTVYIHSISGLHAAFPNTSSFPSRSHLWLFLKQSMLCFPPSDNLLTGSVILLLVCVCMCIHICIHICVYVCIHNPLVLWDMGSNYFSIEPGNYGVSC